VPTVFHLPSGKLGNIHGRKWLLGHKHPERLLKNVAGCVEHAETLTEALHDARRHQKSICISLVDLENAYGSVPHTLIQFAMQWYHLPKIVAETFFSYYEHLLARVTLPFSDQLSSAFHLGIGVFQGCTASCGIFNMVFNLKTDFMRPLANSGYKFTSIPVQVAWTVFADDDSNITARAAENQLHLDRGDEWLDWTRTMKAKPPKCRSLAFKQFLQGDKGRFTPYQPARWSAYNPLLKVGKADIPCMWEVDEIAKYLGTFIQADLHTDRIKVCLSQKFMNMMTQIDARPLTGMMKVWIYEHMVKAKMSWDLMVHDISITWVKEELQPTVDRMLKKWTSLAKPSSTNIFYRSKRHFGLHLTHMVNFTKKVQVLRELLLKHSNDPKVAAINRAKEERHHREVEELRARWRPSKALAQAESAVFVQGILEGSQTGLQGLGFRRVKKINSDPQHLHRQRVMQQLEIEAETKRFAEEADHTVQGSWQKWQSLAAQDMGWSRMIYRLSPEAMRFLLNSTMDTCPTPANLRRWQLSTSGTCLLCGQHGTLAHQLNSCKPSFPRYLWRHDSILQIVAQFVRIAVNRGAAVHKRGGRPTKQVQFVRAGEFIKCNKAERRPDTILEEARDWQLLFDLNYDNTGCKRPTFFPADVFATRQIPDGVIWSPEKKIIIILELGVPWEENIVESHIRKQARYEQLEAGLKLRGWRVTRLEFEVGSRGYVNDTVPRLWKTLGLTKREATSAKNKMSDTALLCSYVIFSARKTPDWRQQHLMGLHFLREDESVQSPHSLKGDFKAVAGAAFTTGSHPTQRQSPGEFEQQRCLPNHS